MKSFARSGALAVICFLIGTSLASAQATRTWVSGVGDDANPCSRTAPCKTFAGAISKTATGGEIDMLDPGGFGTVMITKSITIASDGPTMAGVVASFTNGITINGANVVVTLRRLNLNGIAKTGSGGLIGVRMVQGASLLVDNCVISGFQTGIQIESGNALVRNSVISDNTVVGGTATAGSLTFENSTFVDNQVAVQSDAGAAIRLSSNSFYNNGAAFACGTGGVLASDGNNRKANNSGAGVSVCVPNATVTVQ